MAKTFTIKTSKSGRATTGVRENLYVGTLEQLTQNFSYTLEIGNSWNRKINRWPKTIKSLVTNLQMSYEEKEASCYDRTSVELIETVKA